MNEMKLDVVIPTYNRARILTSALKSLFTGQRPSELRLRVIVVDNNSQDNTAETVKTFPADYLLETKQGRSHALNAGIAAATGDLVAMIDDDEEVTESWFCRIAQAFRQPGLDFIGGPCLPKFEVPPPAWLYGNLKGAVGWLEFGDTPQPYGPEFQGLLLGGNVIIRRILLQSLGPYNTAIGRRGNRLMTGEDDEMYARLLNAGAVGMFFPDLIVYHWIPAERLSKPYLRRWAFWAGVSQGIRDRQKPEQAARILGLPRYMYGQLARAPLNVIRKPSSYFAEEVRFWSFAGLFYGKHWYKDQTD